MFADASVWFTTPVGRVTVAAHGRGAAPPSAAITASSTRSDLPLPKDMTLDGAVACDVRGVCAGDGSLRICLTVDPVGAASAAEPNSGEHLDCAIIEGNGGQLALGVRDRDWMLSAGVRNGFLPERFAAARSQPIDSEIAGYRVAYVARGLELDVGPFAAGDQFRIPLALAWAPSRPDTLASWFGVDAILPH